MTDPDIAAALASVPMLAAYASETWHMVSLPSLTNRVWRVRGPGGDFVLRIENAAPYLDRAREAHNHRLAAGIGLAPPLLYHDVASGVMVTAFETDAISFGRAPDRAAAIAAVARGFRRLHDVGLAFEGEMRLATAMNHYLDIAGEGGKPVESVWQQWRERLEPVLTKIESGLVPSHVDPVPDNILLMPDDTAPVVRFVDWEYSAPAAVVWDLADFAIEARLDNGEQAALLVAYAGKSASRLEPAFKLYQALLDLLAAAWGASQNELQGERADHRRLIETRLGRACAAIDSPGFGRLVEDLERHGAGAANDGH